GGQDEYGHRGDDRDVDHEGEEPGREARVVPLQVLLGGRWRGGRGLARTRGHDAAVARSPAGGPGGPVYGRRRRRLTVRAMASSTPTVLLRSASVTPAAIPLEDLAMTAPRSVCSTMPSRSMCSTMPLMSTRSTTAFT